MQQPEIISSLEWTERKSSSIIIGFSVLSIALIFTAVIYSICKLRMVRKEINELQGMTPRNKRNTQCEIAGLLEKKYFRMSGLSALLAVVIGYMSPTSVWPQPQISLAVLGVLQAQASSIAFCDTNQDEIIDKVMDIFAVMVTLLVLIKVSYIYEWQTQHNPRTFTIIAFVMEGCCALLWLFFSWRMHKQVVNSRTLGILKIRRDISISIVVFVTSIVAIVFAAISSKDSYSHDIYFKESTLFADPIILATFSLIAGLVLQVIVVIIGMQTFYTLDGQELLLALLEMTPRSAPVPV